MLPFVDLHDYGDMLVAAGFATPVMDMEKLTITYSTTDKLLADVRALGGNPQQALVDFTTDTNNFRKVMEALAKTVSASAAVPPAL